MSSWAKEMHNHELVEQLTLSAKAEANGSVSAGSEVLELSEELLARLATLSEIIIETTWSSQS